MFIVFIFIIKKIIVNTIDLNTRVSQKPEVITSEIDGETVMMNIGTGRYIGLNSVGSRIWQLLEQPSTTREIIEVLSDEYHVSEEMCRKDVLEYIQELYESKLITLIP